MLESRENVFLLLLQPYLASYIQLFLNITPSQFSFKLHISLSSFTISISSSAASSTEMFNSVLLLDSPVSVTSSKLRVYYDVILFSSSL